MENISESFLEFIAIASTLAVTTPHFHSDEPDPSRHFCPFRDRYLILVSQQRNDRMRFRMTKLKISDSKEALGLSDSRTFRSQTGLVCSVLTGNGLGEGHKHNLLAARRNNDCFSQCVHVAGAACMRYDYSLQRAPRFSFLESRHFTFRNCRRV